MQVDRLGATINEKRYFGARVLTLVIEVLGSRETLRIGFRFDSV